MNALTSSTAAAAAETPKFAPSQLVPTVLCGWLPHSKS